jgi:hypothetical protein
MLDLLKKYGVKAGLAAAIVVALTVIPLYFQYKTTVDFDARITALEKAAK